jgi:ABC-type hemin transport system ATPase subunit
MILAINLSFVMDEGRVAANDLTSEILEDEKLSTARGLEQPWR